MQPNLNKANLAWLVMQQAINSGTCPTQHDTSRILFGHAPARAWVSAVNVTKCESTICKKLLLLLLLILQPLPPLLLLPNTTYRHYYYN